jgi:hypothetical protein
MVVFEKYRQSFLDSGIDGGRILDVDDAELQAVGVLSKIHRRQMLKHIAVLKSGGS